MNLFSIILSINVIDISRQTIYGTYLNENFYLIKINKPHPKNFNKKINNITIIYISISFEDYIFIKISQKLFN